MCSIEFIESPILNISSAIVYARPGQDSDLRDQLIQLPGVEVHAASEDGKIIVTIEAENDHGAIDIYEAIARLNDVLNVAMIFQQTESHPDQELVVKSRLVINTFNEQFWFFLLPFLECSDRGEML